MSDLLDEFFINYDLLELVLMTLGSKFELETRIRLKQLPILVICFACYLVEELLPRLAFHLLS